MRHAERRGHSVERGTDYLILPLCAMRYALCTLPYALNLKLSTNFGSRHHRLP